MKGKIADTPTGFSTIQTDETLRETILHGTPDYGFEFYAENMDMFDFRCVDWHWHVEFEIFLIQSGNVECFIGNEIFSLHKDEAVFINSKILHKFTSEKSAEVPNILFSPSFLSEEDSLIYRKFILPVLKSNSDFLIISPHKNKSHKKIVCLLKKLFLIQTQKDQEELKEIRTKQILLKVWSLIFSCISLEEKHTAFQNSLQSGTRTQVQLQMMMQFIQENYRENITLEQIAASVNVSKSTALNVFSKVLNDSPVNYLIAYRLKQAAYLLKTTDDKIDFIAQSTGFDSAAYFCRKFKNHFGVTPGMYRKKHLAN